VSAAEFPPTDGWCVEVVEREGRTVVEQQVFSLAEDARDFAKQHVWRNKDHAARVFERVGGQTVFQTQVAFPR
jgi:hypothetical protein